MGVGIPGSGKVERVVMVIPAASCPQPISLPQSWKLVATDVEEYRRANLKDVLPQPIELQEEPTAMVKHLAK